MNIERTPQDRGDSAAAGEFRYPGLELELFSRAANWKNYVRHVLERHVVGDVLEVGAGIAGTTRVLCDGRPGISSWLCLEPDPGQEARIRAAIADGLLPATCRSRRGVIADLPAEPAFDTILYMDVLEHIEDDRAEVAAAAGRLRPGGHLVILVPAYDWLFSELDVAVGHYRRYTRRSLAAVVDPTLEQVSLRYLDLLGILAVLGNRLVLRRRMPSAAQIATWDRLIVPVSRYLLDPCSGYRAGKSLLGIWRKKG